MAIGVVSLSYLLLLCLPLLSEGRETRRPLRSVKAPAETIVDYDVATPAVTYRSSQEDYPKQLHILIKTGDSSLTLQLQRNDYLLSAGFTSRHYTPDGAVVEEEGHDHCFYQGQVLEHPGWSAAMSTCHGLRGSFGDRGIREKFYHLEPLRRDSLSLEQPHALYLDTELKQRVGQCGTASHGGVKGSPPSLEAALPGRAGRRLRRLVSGFYIVEWTIYNDIAQYQAFESSTNESKFRALETANNVDNLYRVLRIRIALVAVVTWSSGDPITSSTDPNAVLNGFQSYLVGQPLTDSAMLMTGRELDGNLVGLASVATMCSGGQSSGLSQDGGRSTDGVAATAAHELGHILNMRHDDAASCNCADGQSQCIMAAVSGPDQPTMWSQCSDDDLNEGFGSLSLNRCLTNEPIMIVGDPACGNGIREGEEVCDCGIAEECQDPCCNSSTCQLVDGAQCFSGDCCNSSCQFVTYGTMCRSAGGECGILEYCSGQDGTCPQDLHRQSGQACNNNQSLCYEGQCPSHQQQCLFHFGSGASDAHEQCFIQLNDNGNRNGNCGHSTTNFLPCSTSNTLCGQLQCVADFNNFINHFNLAVMLQTSSVRIPSGPFTSCTSFTTAVGSDVKSPGLTQDGTKCGDNKFCLEQSCVAVNQPACPSADRGSICSGNGQCNNLNQCSCNMGFSGDTCSAVGPGGGGGGGNVTSGPPGQFSCNATCPPMPFVSGLSDTCTVQWTRPQTPSCGPVTGYTVAITTLNPSVDVAASSFTHETAALEPFTSYTATITAVNNLGMIHCSYIFSTSQEEFPVNFTFQLQLLTYKQNVNISISPAVALSPRVATYSVAVTDVTGQQVGAVQTFPGSSSSLSLNISSLPQCMSYTVSVTAINTGGSATTNDTLSLDPLISLEVSCVAGRDGCYLEASCVPSQPGLVSGCRLDYTSSAGSESRNVTQLSVGSRSAQVSCDNPIISYTGTAYDSMLRQLRCSRSGMTKCPPIRDCTVLGFTDGTVQYSTEPSASGDFTGGTVATYSCADGYELVGDKNRTCLVDGTWTGDQPQCTELCEEVCRNSVNAVLLPVSVTLLIYSVLSTVATAALALALCRMAHQKGGHRAAIPSHSTKEEVALKENLCYGPVAPPPPPPPAATQTVSEYEEIGAPSPKHL